MTLKSISGVGAAAVLTLLLAACGGATPPASSSSASQTASTAPSSQVAPPSSQASSASSEVSSSAAPVSSSSSALASPVAPASSDDGKQYDQLKLMAPMAIPDRPLGDPNAKVTVIEYLSPTCPHCALVANTVIGPFKDKYVATGKVQLILRPFSRNTLDAGIFLLAEAAAKAAEAPAAPTSTDASAASDASAPAPAPTPAPSAANSQAAAVAWENVVDTFFKTQQTWENSDRQLDAVKAVAFQLGFNEDSFNAALKDDSLYGAIQGMVDQAVKDFGVSGTPTFYVNGKQMTGEKTLDELSAAVDPLLH